MSSQVGTVTISPKQHKHQKRVNGEGNILSHDGRRKTNKLEERPIFIRTPNITREIMKVQLF